jgi:choline dehydrogenase-like flavoprotein
MRLQSRGHLRLRSSDPFEAPAIQPNYLSCQADLDALVEGVKFARRVVRAEAFAPFRGAETCPGSQAEDDKAFADHIRNFAETHYHPVGTFKMGNDPMAVVDDQLRVHGILGLRIVDASIMPIIPAGNTNAPTIMIAERAADLIQGSTSLPAILAVERVSVSAHLEASLGF